MLLGVAVGKGVVVSAIPAISWV